MRICIQIDILKLTHPSDLRINDILRFVRDLISSNQQRDQDSINLIYKTWSITSWAPSKPIRTQITKHCECVMTTLNVTYNTLTYDQNTISTAYKL